MDPETESFRPREDFWRLQSEMLRVQQGQAELSDRVSRLERRHEEDSRLKNVWGTSSPFPSVLGGTPQQVPLQQPTAEHFSNFDHHASNLIGNLQLDADDEPRRIGTTSRANSVRFDETANHGHWAHTSRSSLDLIPRTGSGLGGQSMSERSYSHKSDGRQSSTGHSAHSATSGRANSLTGYGPTTPTETPGLAPGFFILGSVPSIIRCWLNTNFKHDALLYAAVCSGSYASYLDIRLIDRLGFRDRIFKGDDNSQKIKLSVYLPEAIPISASSRSSSPTPQLPCLHIEFNVAERNSEHVGERCIQVFLGSDVLRAHNADILFSTNQLTLYDDDHSKLLIPLVRPEDERTFKSLFTTSETPESVTQQTPTEEETENVLNASKNTVSDLTHVASAAAPRTNGATTNSDDGSGGGSFEQRPLLGLSTNRIEPKDAATESSPASAAPRPGASPAIWGSNWRRDAEKPGSLDWASAGKNPTSTYQRRDTGIKVLKPMKGSSRSTRGGESQPSSSATPSQSRFFDEGRRRVSTISSEAGEHPKSASGERAKEAALPTGKTRPANPVGGASAFPWLNNEAAK